MDKIYLIGDSIRFGATTSPGYGVYVKQKLLGKAEVYAPKVNCQFAQYTQRYLHEWVTTDGVPKEEIDVVHWNNGLWDVLRLLGDDPFTEISFYGETLRRVFGRIRYLFPNAKVIFALSTSVKEEWAKPDFLRLNCDIERYNQKAIEVLAPLGVEFNDLYAVTKEFDDSLRSDWVHFGERGSDILADAVIKRIYEVI